MLIARISFQHAFKLDLITPFRSSRRRCSVTKGVLRNFKKFRKTPAQERFFNKAAGLRLLQSGYNNTFS